MEKKLMGEAVLCTLIVFSQLFSPSAQENTSCDVVALGLESGIIPNSSLTASSVLDVNHGANRARLNLAGDGILGGAWSASVNDIHQWIQVDLLTPHRIFGLATQGRQDCCSQWVTSFKIACSDDGVSFDTVQDLSTPGTDKTPSTIPSGMWAGTEEHPVQETTPALAPSTTPSAGTPVILTQCEEDRVNTQVSMTCPTGYMIVITEGICVRVTACGAFDKSLADTCMGDKTAQWGPYCRTTNPCDITCTGSTLHCSGDQSYAYADYECEWAGTGEPPLQDTTPGLVFNGNSDRDTVVNNTLPVPQVCRYIRLLPQTWHNHISLRMELYGTAQVTVDAIPPEVHSCPQDQTFTAPVGTTTNSFTWTPPTATDAAGIQSIVSDHQPGVEVSVDNPITVTYTVTDYNGLTNTDCSFTLSVVQGVFKRSAVYRLVASDRALIDTHSSHLDVTSVIRCGQICFEDGSCKFFTYIKRTGACLLGQRSTTEKHHEAATYTC